MRVLTLSTYPIASPRHGGQHRLHHIVAAYRRAGFATQSAGVLGGINYEPEDGFLPCPAVDALSRYIANPMLMEDWAIGRLVATDDEAYRALCERIRAIPDCIHVEQPWMFAFAQRYAREFAPGRVRLIYGSANVEHELKRRILAGYLPAATAAAHAALVFTCETEAAAAADLVVATSPSDADWLAGHTTAEVILARNGVPERMTTDTGVALANDILRHARALLYAASAHPPNIVGFFAMLRRGVGCMAPDQRIVVAGSAGPNIRSHPQFDRTPGLASRFIDAGEVTEECLQGLLAVCHAIVLPITQGGGTNLKTAEALWAGCWVVATPVAMRGFEPFADCRGLSVCADETAFRQAIGAVMRSPPLHLTNSERRARRSLLWEATLAPLTARVAQFGAGRP